MSKRQARSQDPIHSIIEDALEPGFFISWSASYSFLSGLRQVEERIAGLVQAEPIRAAGLYETFIAGCNEKAEEIDDSDGELGMFAGGLFCGWIRARQAADADRDETSKLLLAWMDDDPYGFCNDLVPEAVKVFDRAGLEAFERQVRLRLQAALDKRKRSPRPESDFHLNHWGQMLKAIYVQQRNIPKYLEVASQIGLTQADCEAVATMFQAKRKPQDALSWVERGLEMGMRDRFETGAARLAEMRRALLAKLGRSEEALQSAWTEFQAHPNRLTYEELLRYVPKAERGAWREKAMAASEKADLTSAIELWLAAKEIARLVQRLERTSDAQLENLSHYVTEPAAQKLALAHPGVAARVYRALCVRILNAGKSKYYHAALSSLEKARDCYQRAGRESDWIALVAEIRRAHHRKTGFMPGFERIAAGKEASREPSFLERARGRWVQRAKL